MVQQQISVVTLGVGDLTRSRRFYGEGFGWEPVFESDEILFFQMNGLMLGPWLKDRLAVDMQRGADGGFHAMSLAHNVAREADVAPLVDRLAAHGASSCAGPTRRPMAAFAAMSPTPTTMSGKSRTIPPDRSTIRAMSRSHGTRLPDEPPGQRRLRNVAISSSVRVGIEWSMMP